MPRTQAAGAASSRGSRPGAPPTCTASRSPHDGRRNGKHYRYAYGIASTDGGFPDRITKADLHDGTSASWSEPGTYPGEPVFARAPDTEQEDSGVLLSVVLDPAAGTSFLLALDAANLSEIGRARVPHHVPFGFHGSYFPQPS
jgi:beta,beta-carotene 9',10'-dioxygenase